MTGTTRAPRGDLTTYETATFTDAGKTRTIFRKGTGPAVIVISELPGISPMVLGFADRVVALGCTAVLLQLFGQPGREPFPNGKIDVGYEFTSFNRICISKEFTVFATGKSSRIITWLRALAAEEHVRNGGPGVGVVGMCYTGGFALAMAVDGHVLAPVLSQPSLPVALTKKQKASIDTTDADLEIVSQRCANEGLRVLGLRFKNDPFVPDARFSFLKERLGDGFVAVELHQRDGNPASAMRRLRHHSVLTGDLVNEPGEPTRRALEQVMELFRTKLLAST